jgi:hypothetical protein
MTPTVRKLLNTLGPQYGEGQNVLLAALLGAWGYKLDEARADGDAAIAQLSVLTASSVWLDQWGLLYTVMRLPNEDDNAYAMRIIAETIHQRPQPLALERIVNGMYDLAEFFVRDLWPSVLLSDQWTMLPGVPLQVSDGQNQSGFLTFGPNMATVSFSVTYTPGSFGIWVTEQTSAIISYTLQQIITLLPLELIGDQFSSADHVSDGQLTTPGYGTPSDTARHALNLPAATFPTSVDAILALINQHRAAGTKPVVMGTQLQPVG